jgi:choline transporter-like protein 2/4/5
LGFGFTIFIAFVLMFLMRWIAAIIIWVSIFAILFIFIAFGLIFLYQGGVIKSNDVGSVLGTLGIPTTSRNDYYNVYGYISFGIAGLLFLVMLCCCSRIKLAVAVCKVAGQFLIRVAQVLLVPIVMTTVLLALWAFGLSAMVYIISTATFVADGDIFTSITDWTSRSLGMFYYFFFGILWVNAYLGALSIFVVASCCSMWYFSRGPGDELNSPVITSYWRSFRFHWGSLAFGALIIAIVQMI